MSELKPVVPYEAFEKLDIRVGRVMKVEPAPEARKPSWLLTVDFGKYGVKRSVARLTTHAAEELTGKQVFGVLNFEPREIGGIVSEFLTLGRAGAGKGQRRGHDRHAVQRGKARK